MKHSKLYSYLKEYIFTKLLCDRKQHVKVIRSFVFNLKCFGFRIALKMPIYLYDVEFLRIPNIVIDSDICRGMIKIGSRYIKSKSSTIIDGTGKMIFRGQSMIMAGCTIECFGVIEIGNNVKIGPNCEIVCLNGVVLGNNTTYGYYTTIMDTDYHYILNVVEHKIHRNGGGIFIGDGTWIGSRSRIMKNIHIPKNCIVASGSLINKNIFTDECAILAGIPAKQIKVGYRRVFNKGKEEEYNLFFRNNPGVDELIVDFDDSGDSICLGGFWDKVEF